MIKSRSSWRFKSNQSTQNCVSTQHITCDNFSVPVGVSYRVCFKQQARAIHDSM